MSPELTQLIKSMMRADPERRVDVQTIYLHPVVSRARAAMEQSYTDAVAAGTSTFAASPLAGVGTGFLAEILGKVDDDSGTKQEEMDLSP